MIKEIFSSFSRTLGRILAYIFIGFIFFFLFSKVNADEFEEASYITLYGSGATTTTCSFAYMCPSGLLVPNDKLFSNVYWHYNFTLTSGNTYEYAFTGQIITSTPLGNNISGNIGKNMQVVNGSNVQTATCDTDCLINYYYRGTTRFYLTSTGGQTAVTGYIYEMTWEGKLNVNGNWTGIRFNMWSSSIIAGTPYSNLLIAENELSNSEAIIKNANDNANKIINNQNNNTQTIVNNNNSNTTRITDKQDVTNQKLDNINNSLIDNTPPDVTIFQDIGNYQPSNTPLTDIITLPITIINNEINGLNGTCQAWEFGSGPLLGSYTIRIPCLDMSQYFSNFSYQGYNLWQIIDFMCCLFMGYQILMLIISAYNDISSLNDTFHRLYTPTSYWAEPGKVYYS